MARVKLSDLYEEEFLREFREINDVLRGHNRYNSIIKHYGIKKALACEKHSVCNVDNVDIHQIIDFYFKEKYSVE